MHYFNLQYANKNHSEFIPYISVVITKTETKQCTVKPQFIVFIGGPERRMKDMGKL
jgi:hypothetical protein